MLRMGSHRPPWADGVRPGLFSPASMAEIRLSREERRNAILDAAGEVFGTSGFEATRMDDVAKAAGMAKGLLYKHSSSKAPLSEAPVNRQGGAHAAERRRGPFPP